MNTILDNINEDIYLNLINSSGELMFPSFYGVLHYDRKNDRINLFDEELLNRENHLKNGEGYYKLYKGVLYKKKEFFDKFKEDFDQNGEYVITEKK